MKAVIMDSPECTDFLKGLLMRDPAQRMTATEALEHPWFRRHFGESLLCPSSTPCRAYPHTTAADAEQPSLQAPPIRKCLVACTCLMGCKVCLFACS